MACPGITDAASTAVRDPASLPVTTRVLAIPAKRFDRPVLGYLSREQVAAILAAPDRDTWSGRRDAVLLAVAHNTGARVSELSALRMRDVLLDRQTAVHLHDREDPGGLGCQELPPRRAGPTRRRIDARSAQDLPHGGRRLRPRRASPARHGSRRFPHSGFSLARRTTRRATPRTVGGRPGLRRLLVSYLRPASLRCQARSVAGVTGKIPVQCPQGMSRASAANHAWSPGSYRTRPACRRSTAFSCLSRSSSASSPGHRGTPGRPGRVPGTSAGRRS